MNLMTADEYPAYAAAILDGLRRGAAAAAAARAGTAAEAR